MIISPPDENPAFTILRRVIQHKATNNREKLSAYDYEAYNKIEFDLNNITEEFTQKKLFKPFAFIFDNVDSTDAKPYLPIFMTETLSDVHYRQKPEVAEGVHPGHQGERHRERERVAVHGRHVPEREHLRQLPGDLRKELREPDR